MVGKEHIRLKFLYRPFRNGIYILIEKTPSIILLESITASIVYIETGDDIESFFYESVTQPSDSAKEIDHLNFLISDSKHNIASYNRFCKNIIKNRHIILIRRKINYQTHFIDYNFRLNILFSGIFRIVNTFPGHDSRGMFHNKIPRYSRIAPVTVFPAPAEPGDDDCTANATDYAQ